MIALIYGRRKKESEFDIKKKDNGRIHPLLIRVYTIFFVSIILGVLFDLYFEINLLDNFEYSYLGILIIFLGTFLIYIAQKASARAGKIKKDKVSSKAFAFGPYKYFKHPTYLGVFFMVLGFGIVIKSIFSILFILITYLFIKLVLVKRRKYFRRKIWTSLLGL